MKKWIVFLIIVIWAVATIIYDIFLAVDNVAGNTISAVITEFSYKLPLIPISFGFLAGHFFINKWSNFQRDWHLSIPLTVLGVLILIFQIMAIWLNIAPIIPFLISLPMGGIFWSQRGQKLGLRRK